MTPQQFQSTHAEWLRAILNDPKGQSFFNALAAYQPPYPTSEVPHIFAKGVGQREGFEGCIKAIVQLASAPKPASEIAQTYGVEEAKKEAK